MKICFISYDFCEKNIRLMPWRYIHKISLGLKKNGVDVYIITNRLEFKDNNAEIDGLKIYYDPLKPKLSSNSIPFLLEHLHIDTLIFPLAPKSIFFYFMLKRCKLPVYGLWNYPLYKIRELVDALVLNTFSELVPFFVNSLFPFFFTKILINSQIVKKVVVLSKKNKTLFIKKGVKLKYVHHIPPGINAEEKELPAVKNEFSLKRRFLYLGSPKFIRGADIVIKAFSEIKKQGLDVSLTFLSRSFTSKDSILLKGLAKKLGILDDINWVEGFLPPEEVKNHIYLSDVVLLPFRVVQSDMPVTALEAMALGKVLIVTNVDGLPEMAGDRGEIIKANSVDELVRAMEKLIKQKELLENYSKKARQYMLSYPTWEELANDFYQTINILC